jgi:hypothetical protein
LLHPLDGWLICGWTSEFTKISTFYSYGLVRFSLLSWK